MCVQYPESFDVVARRCASNGYEKLSENERLVYAIWWLEGEINNGGFHQYFWNSAGDNTRDTLIFLSTIGASHTAELLTRACVVAFGGEAPDRRDLRQELLAIDEDVKREQLELLDDMFYEYRDDIAGLVNRFLSQ